MNLRPDVPVRSISSLVLPDGAQKALRGFVDGSRVGATTNAGKALFLSGGSTTAAAEAVAHELGRRLLRVDLSAVVSKFIGETDKNLNAVFADAERSSAALFFDEADALFGKRSEVKDGHDRFANIEIAYLLQKMESFNGVTIVATKAPVKVASCRFCRYVDLGVLKK